MDLEILDVVSSLHAVDDAALLSPKIMQRIVDAVVHALESKHLHEARTNAERRITGGVSAEQEGEE